MENKFHDYEEVGFIKYSGKGVVNGIIDASSAGSALLGLDDAIRFFNSMQSPELGSIDYQIPVKTREGSWEVPVMAISAVAGAFFFGYAKKAGEKMAENDFKDIGFKDVFKKITGCSLRAD